MGTEKPWRGDAEPSHREGICKPPSTHFQLLPATRIPVTSPPLYLGRVHLKIKCAQYWPHREERDAVFEDTNFKLTLVSEDIKSYYTVRQLELENLSVSIQPL